MKTYSVLFAEDIPHYGVAEIEAEDDAAALEAAKAYDLSEVTNDPEWENSVSKRIVHIEDPDGNTVAYDVPLDDYSLRSGSDKDRALCDAAPGLLEAAIHALGVCEAEAENRGENDTDDYAGGAAGPVAEMLRAAIAKAKGGAI